MPFKYLPRNKFKDFRDKLVAFGRSCREKFEAYSASFELNRFWKVILPKMAGMVSPHSQMSWMGGVNDSVTLSFTMALIVVADAVGNEERASDWLIVTAEARSGTSLPCILS